MTPHLRPRPVLLGALAAVTMATALTTAAQPKFMPDDPLWVERDTESAAGMRQHEPSLFVDFAYNVITGGDDVEDVRAGNVNTVDEVPDSSWFTNRAGRRALSADEVRTGPNTTAGPAAGTWRITSSKSDGVTPGFTIKDESGQRWFLKFDPPGYRGMATGTEVTVTKLLWALGYNVPENHIAYMRRDQLVIGDGASFTPAGGRKRAMKPSDVERLLDSVNREANGSFRVVASKALEGTPVGRIRFDGTRPDDPNDLVAHEHRRELRGYGTFAAWLNHVDAKSINSLDMLVKTADGKSVVRHYLLDFGSALGSGALAPADYWAGSAYVVEPEQVVTQIASFGFARPQLLTQKFYEAPSIGRLPLHNGTFDPRLWKPRVPNRAFVHARDDDRFWAAQKLAGITTDMIRAAVASGDFGDPASETFLVDALRERRDAILRAYLTAVNPIADPALSNDGTLTFRNAAVDADVARAPREYQARWLAFDNTTRSTSELGMTRAAEAALVAPARLAMAAGTYVKIELTATSADYPTWGSPVTAYFERTDSGWRLVGFERLPDLEVVATITD